MFLVTATDKQVLHLVNKPKPTALTKPREVLRIGRCMRLAAPARFSPLSKHAMAHIAQ